ncbi:MAG: hypothetical protein V2B19_07420 [Pseudomonadota bacterium]
MSNYKAPVTVEVADRASWIEIFDGRFQVVAQGFGQIQTELAPGLYKARTQVGGAVREKMFAVDTGLPLPPVRLDPVAFPSPAPLQNTTTSHEYHQHAVAMATANAEPPINLGSGSSLLLSVRDPSRAPFEQTDHTRDAYARSYDGFSLCALDGSELINYDHAAKRDVGFGFAIRNAQLNPGHYLLKYQPAKREQVVLPIVTVMGWATQLFIHIEEGPSTSATRRPVLREAAVMMVPLGQPFHPGDRYFRLTEVARQALQQGRNILDRELMKDLLESKFANPVLGLFAAHLLLLDGKPRLELLRIVVDNLGGILGGDFPDVIALRCRLQQLEPSAGISGPIQGPMGFPPLLRASWEIVASLAAANETIFPAGSVSRQVADRLADNGIWMAWRPSLPPVEASVGGAMLSNNELHVKKFRDRERILAVFDQADQFVDLNAGSNLLNAAKTLAKPVIREKLRQFIKTMANTDSDRFDLLPEFIERLAKNYSWEDLARKLIELDVDGEISSQLSSVQKLLIPALMMFRQQLSSGDTVNPELYEKLLGSLRVPRSVLIDNLGDLARLAAGLALRMHDENTAEGNVAPHHPG